MAKTPFQNKLKKHFRFRELDCAPHLVTGRVGSRRIHGRILLADFLNTLGVKKGVEIGTRQGGSALLWCNGIPGLDLTCIDPWKAIKRWPQKRQDNFYKRAIEVLTPFNVKILKMRSMDALSKFDDESLDFVYIDGNHEFDYCCPDIIYWSQKVRKGGVVIVHDYCPFHWNGVMKAVEAYTHCHEIRPWYVTKDKTPTAFWEKP